MRLERVVGPSHSSDRRQGHVVVTQDDQLRGWKSCQQNGYLGELRGARPHGEIAGDDGERRGRIVHVGDEGIHERGVMGPEVEVGKMGDHDRRGRSGVLRSMSHHLHDDFVVHAIVVLLRRWVRGVLPDGSSASDDVSLRTDGHPGR